MNTWFYWTQRQKFVLYRSICSYLWLICQVFWAIYLTSVSHKLRKMKDSNLRYPCGYNTLAGCRFKPLSQSSVVVLTGIEPVTHGFSVHCSTYWAIIPFCTPVRTRTWNHRFWRPTFYQLNYGRVSWWFYYALTLIFGLNACFNHHCSSWRTRTLNPLIRSEVLYPIEPRN